MFNAKEIKQLVALLKKIDNPHQGLPQPVFDALIKIVPFAACELAVVDGKGGILLTWREDEWYKGWHFPGRLMRFRESFEECIKNAAQDELNIKISSHKFLFVKDYSQSPRGHVVSLVFRCQTTETVKQGKFFKKMPKDIIEDHKELWRKIQKF